MISCHHRPKPRILFICKKKTDAYGVSFGLLNSATFVANALVEQDIEARVVTVVDNNAIDREVSLYKPTHVMVEAIWVVPSKFRVLKALHPTVQWAVRIHSKTPFLANEGNAVEWIKGYAREGVIIAPNSKELTDNLINGMDINATYLPNIYAPPMSPLFQPAQKPRNSINVGCFGAVRPMKNHLMQAFSAIQFANWLNLNLRFHINANRIEQKGESQLSNLRALFSCGFRGELVEHPWLPHDNFVTLVRQMDIGMQVSLSESFNIVVADFVWNGVPIVASSDVDWMPEDLVADPTCQQSILSLMQKVWKNKEKAQKNSLRSLRRHNEFALKEWLKFV